MRWLHITVPPPLKDKRMTATRPDRANSQKEAIVGSHRRLFELLRRGAITAAKVPQERALPDRSRGVDLRSNDASAMTEFQRMATQSLAGDKP